MQRERYSPQPLFPVYASRSSTPNMVNPADSRRLPPLTTSSTSPIKRCQQPSFTPQPTGFSGNSIRYPPPNHPPPTYFAYSTANRANAYSHHLQPHGHVTSMNPQGHGGMFEDVPRLDLRSSSGYAPGVPQHESELDARSWKSLFHRTRIRGNRRPQRSA
ncbi:hypothetical protein GALMADRAFT_1200805 [Galerina marginata CBS 339.88]|uniref:Uncharacterized protein n=1 Tax=Galerina marginata (strain CBS 339.88) TaxID=685588 RepID=A0A067TDR0_GALM3|nr:hypothetical protein GALMADRAFT_1200805 [Galerina marginata CBS 339.88]